MYNWLRDNQKILEFCDETWNKEDIRNSIESVLPDGYIFSEHYISSKERSLEPADMKKDRACWRCGEKLYSQILCEDP